MEFVTVPTFRLRLERLPSSASGNPRWLISPEGRRSYRTAPNSSCAYEAEQLLVSSRAPRHVELMLDGRGQVVGISPAGGAS